MKIEINMSEIFEDEYGNVLSKDLADRIQDAIIEKAQDTIDKIVRKQFQESVAADVKPIVENAIEKLIVEMLDEKFVPTDRWGSKEDDITLRDIIRKDISHTLQWKDGNYDSDKSPYTKVIKKLVEEKLKEFAREYTKTVDEQFIAECMEFAVKKLKSRMGI